MCLNPILIKNVNYGNTSKLAYTKDTSAQFLAVPCGRCSVCLSLKQNYIVQRVQMEALSHDLFFLTLTYNNESLPSLKVGEFKLNYVDISDWQNMLKMIRKHENLPKFKYLLVTEYGGRRHRPHIHAILSFPKDVSQNLAQRRSFEMHLFSIFLKYWRRNKGSTRKPIWIDNCTYVRNSKGYNYDLHYLDPNSTQDGLDDVAFYATKYCLKYDKWFDKLKSKLFFNLPESDYIETLDKIRPRRLMSKGFGSPRDPKVIEHINKGIDFALGSPGVMYPYFISPVNGSTFPLAPYYSKLFLKLEDLEVFNSRKPLLTDYDSMVDTSPTIPLYKQAEKQRKFEVVQDFLFNRHTYFDDDFKLINDYGETIEIPRNDSEVADNWQNSDFGDCDMF